MSGLVLTLIDAPRAQAVRQMRLGPGDEVVIGRGTEAGWRLEDPDNYVSRAHCLVSGRDGGFTVTDTSSGGLYVDGGRAPLGPGRPLELRDGMRLRLGDFVLQVELRASMSAAPLSAAPRPPVAPAAPRAPEFDADVFFTPEPEPPRPARPRDLPDPFDPAPSFVPAIDTTPPERRGPPLFDDPFTLDPASSSPAPPRARERERPVPEGFDWGGPPPSAPSPEPPIADGPKPGGAPSFDWGPSAPATPPPSPMSSAPRATAPAGEAALFDAFLRGLGLDPADAPEGDPVARMEGFGREYRLMAEGYMRLLRLRAEEKGSARIAQTVVGAAEVNPLKFMPGIEDALAVMVARRSAGFAAPEVAVAGAVRDLAAHHLGTWRGTQAALRRMVDRFDPAALEKELEALGLLEQLLAGGRRAKLWELYQKRFREIADSAETRFLGEVGADFRDAYEGEN